MIKETESMKYNKERNEYYVTRNGCVNELPYHDNEFDERVENFDKWLKLWNKRVYQIIYTNNHVLKRKQIHDKIYHNLENERQAIYDAVLLYVLGAMEGEMDMNPFSDGKTDIPKPLIDVLENANLIYQGQYAFDDVPYSEYKHAL